MPSKKQKKAAQKRGGVEHHDAQHPLQYAAKKRYAKQQDRLKAIRDSYEEGLPDESGVKHDGLVEVSRRLGGTMLAPRDKVTVMLMGNHSAGKSSFINWYLSEGGLHKEVQETGSAITTNSFTVLTQGEEGAQKLDFDMLMDHFPQLRPLEKEKETRFAQKDGARKADILEALALLPVAAPRLDNVDLIDTPGLVDGLLQYPFDINEAVCFLGAQCDHIIVFLDHVGGSHCARTREVLERLSDKHADKISIYVTKIDTVESASDLKKVTQQVAQGLPPNLATQQSLEIRSMYIPHDKKGDVRSAAPEIKAQNEIHKLKTDIEKLVKRKEQFNLERMQNDVKELSKQIATLFPDRMPAALRNHPMLAHVQDSLFADLSAAVLPADMPISARVGSLLVGFIGLLLLHKIASICAVNVGCRTTAEIARLEQDRLVMSCYEKERNNIRKQVLTTSVRLKPAARASTAPN